ncbi:PDDEXK-like family protein [Thalassoroseus pseudoceratinae]|uniref:hypothetical protein n=1 Tax=Thalassoroseus pseudoceratinae TaxID=2713176 RepID=UPI0014229FEE|nr:hypothetical protein [Thalassoroseus pseudoceratinae]
MRHRWLELVEPSRKAAASAPQKDYKSSQSGNTLEWLEQCTRQKIIQNPRAALGIALITGLLAGYWVKR